MSVRAASREAGSWFTSSYSNDGNGCVQVRFDGQDVLVADSKQRGDRPVIRVSAADWDAFVDSVLDDRSPEVGAITTMLGPGNGRTITGPDGVTLSFNRREWAAFTAGAANGEFTRPTAGAARSPVD